MLFPQWANVRLEEYRTPGKWRELRSFAHGGGVISRNGKRILSFASNDYLDLGSRSEIRRCASTALVELGIGSGASRLTSGTLHLHETLEKQLAKLKGYERSLVFGSGYLTNLGVFQTLLKRSDIAIADKFIHASMIDGIRHSGCLMRRFHHNNPDHAEELLRLASKKRTTSANIVIATESVFSMDGDIALLRELAELAKRYEAFLVVDEAHAIGIFGQHGAGYISELSLQEDVHIAVGTLSKALGNYGGFACAVSPFIDLLINEARSLIYTTSLPPSVVASASAAIDVLFLEPSLGKTLLDKSRYFATLLRDKGLTVISDQSQIVPVLIGDSNRALCVSKQLQDLGIIVPAIRHPTVAYGTERLRFSITLAHSEDDLQRAARELSNVLNKP